MNRLNASTIAALAFIGWCVFWTSVIYLGKLAVEWWMK